MIACGLRCSCGGSVEMLIDKIYYILTEDHEIIFRGVGSNCKDNVQVKRDILSLLLICPNGDKKGN